MAIIRATLSLVGLYESEPTLFDNFVIPEGMAADRDTLLSTIMMECAELEVVYTDPDALKFAIGVWSKACLHTWEKLYETTQFEYNPIDNYSMNEKWSENGENIADSNYNRAGFNSTTPQPESTTLGNSITSNSGSRSRTGNIGVTTTQTMITQERNIAKFCMVDYIATEFKQRFCVLVY